MADSGFSERERQAVYRAIYERRDVRNYRPDEVPDALLARVLEAAHRAPSVGFVQPWNFIVLRDRALRQRIHAHFVEVNARAAEVFQGDRKRAYQALKLQGILDAPLNLLVTCDSTRGGEHVLGRFTMPETDVYSTCLAVQNLWLAARSEGLGVGWMSIMEPPAIAELLGLPSSVVPIAYLTLGFPVEFAEQPMLSQVGWQARRPLAELVYEDQWGKPAIFLEADAHEARVAEPGPLASAVQSAPLPAPRNPIAPAPGLLEAAVARNRDLTKPEGSLGRIEQLALQLASLQGTPYPSCDETHLALFAGDHGVTEERVSAFKPDTTLKLVYSYLAGGGVVNALARREQVHVHVVDVGVDHDFGDARGLLRKKVRRGTRNIACEAAMSEAECQAAIAAGREVVQAFAALRVLVVGEVGIGNSTSAAALAAALLGLAPELAVGRGTGVDAEGLLRKRRVVERALALHGSGDENELLRKLGGYEIAASVGAIEAAAERGALVVLDGLIVGVAALIAVRRNPAVASYLLASHLSVEPAHRHVLTALALEPLLSLGLRLGEGTGGVLAVGLLRAACAVMREVRTYEEASIARPEANER